MLSIHHRARPRITAAMQLALMVIGTGFVVGVIVGILLLGALMSASR